MSELAKRIESLPPDKLAKLISELRKKQSKGEKVIRPRKNRNIYPISFAQSRLWFLHQLQPESSFYIIPAILKLTGNLNIKILEKSFVEILKRHEVLRSYFPEEDGEPYLQLHRIEDFVIDIYDYRNDSKSLELDIKKLSMPYSIKEFDLRKDYLFKVNLVRVRNDEHILFLTMHHIIADGWSIKIFVDEFISIYESLVFDKTSNLVDLPIQYADFAEWQNVQMKKGIYDKQYSFWKEILSNMPHTIDLPLDNPRPKIQTFAGKKIKFAIDNEIFLNLIDYGTRNGFTPFMVLFSSFQILLYKISNQEDFGIGIPFVNRNNDETKNLIGFFINTLVINANIDPHCSFTDSTGKLKKFILAAMSNGDLPFEKVVEVLGHKKDLSFSPLFQVMFDYQDKPLKDFEFGDVKAIKLEGEATSTKFDLMLSIENNGDSIEGAFEFNTDLFLESTIERFILFYKKLIESLITEPDKSIYSASILPNSDFKLIKDFAHKNNSIYPKQKTLQQIFKENLSSFETDIAVEYKDKNITFAKLEKESNKLSNYLLSRGVETENIIAVCLERSIESIISILAIWKAGAVYLPLDPAYPSDRIEYILNNSRSRFVLTDKKASHNVKIDASRVINLSLESEKIESENDSIHPVEIHSESLAYIIYTSGSTGLPKGVMISHLSAINLLNSLDNKIYSNYPGKKLKISLNAPLPFDASIQEILMILYGHTLVIIPEEIRLDAYSFISYMTEKKIEVLDCVPTQLEYLTEYELLDVNNQHLKVLLPGGEPIGIDLWNKLRNTDHIISFNMYGPTECTVDTTICNISKNSDKPNIGTPISNVQHYVLNEDMQIVPIGLIGELYISGDCLARGYYGRPDLTAEKFLPDPYGNSIGGRIYRTGDLVQMMPDGSYEYKKRNDDQVKIRGFRIELGEIENLLNAHSGVKKSVVISNTEDNNSNRLIAYVQLDESPDYGKDELRKYLAAKLPNYMIPSVILIIDEIPLLPNGKINKRALPSPDLNMIEEDQNIEIAKTPTEKELVDIWKDLLKVREIGINNNFFELGGDSIKAAILSNKLKKKFNVPLDVKNIFQSSTIYTLAKEIDLIVSEQIKGIIEEEAENRSIDFLRIEKSDEPILSFAQERLWFLNKIDNNESYNISGGVKLKGDIDSNIIKKCLNVITRKHDSLRTTIGVENGKPYPIIDHEEKIDFNSLDLTKTSENEKESRLNTLLTEVTNTIHNLERGPLVKYYIIRLERDEHLLLVAIHHIISDGWSISILLNEFKTLYDAYSAGSEIPRENLEIQYHDYANWQRKLIENSKLDFQAEYWKKQLKDIPEYFYFPTDFPRPPVQSFRGNSITKNIDEITCAHIDQYCREKEITKFIFLLTAFYIVLHKYSGEKDIFIGTPINGRTHEELEPIIGMFVNTLVLRCDVSGELKFNELLVRVKNSVINAFENQDLPFQKVVDIVQPERNLSFSPLFQHMFAYNISEIDSLSIDNLSITELNLKNNTSKFDFSFSLTEESNKSLKLTIEYSTDLFRAETIERLVSNFQICLNSVLQDSNRRICDLSILSQTEENLVRFKWNNTSHSYDKIATIPDKFKEAVKIRAQEKAIVCQNDIIHYKELDERSNQVADYLIENEIRLDDIVGVHLTPSINSVIVLLGILKSGASYMALDPSYPTDRLIYMVEDSSVKLLFSDSKYQYQLNDLSIPVINTDSNNIFANYNKTDIKRNISPPNLAYIIYTSGSTGTPKGIQLSHQGVLNNLNDFHTRKPLIDFSSSLWTSLNFDVSVYEIFYPLIYGGTLHIIPEDLRALDFELFEWIADSKINNAYLPPFKLRQFARWLKNNRSNCELEKLLSGVESIDYQIFKEIHHYLPNLKLLNGYGPAETTICSTLFECCENNYGVEKVPIGKPMNNTKIYILDKYLDIVPIGVVGEIFIESDGISRGYINNVSNTAEKFIPNPYSAAEGVRIYRTGDQGKYLPDGNIMFMGRKDSQVKIRGFRIELGEIESVLNSYTGIEKSVVLIREVEPGEKKLTAYFVSIDTNIINAVQLKKVLAEKLPQYMIPTYFVQLNEFPMLPNKKINYKALPKPEMTRDLLSSEFEEPSNEIESTLVSVWKEVLKIDSVGINDNFFELGGDSILALQIIAKANQYGIKISPKYLFQHPTISSLSAVAEKRETLDVSQSPAEGEILLTPIQKWFFDQNFKNENHWNQSVLFELENSFNPELLKSAIGILISHHDSLRIKFKSANGNWIQYYSPINENIPFEYFDISSMDKYDKTNEIEKLCDLAQSKMDIVSGPTFRCCYFDLGNEENHRLLLVAHHLIIDGISWRIILTDIQKIYNHLLSGERVLLPPKTSSFQHWSSQINDFRNSKIISDQVNYWKGISIGFNVYNPDNNNSNENREMNVKSLNLSLDNELTDKLVKQVSAELNSEVKDILLTALVLANSKVNGFRKMALTLEGHGREDIFADVDVSNTIGWFTTIFPVILDLKTSLSSTESLKIIKEQLREIPNNGLGYGILKYLGNDHITRGDLAHLPLVSFNYLGQFNQKNLQDSGFKFASENKGKERASENKRPFQIDISVIIKNGELNISWIYNSLKFSDEDQNNFLASFMNEIKDFIEKSKLISNAYSPTDFQDVNLEEDDLDSILSELNDETDDE